MSDSNITKRILAMGLKDLIRTRPFEKISVSDICEICEVSRKTFYYHFKDKYDLVEWIFNSEFISVLKKSETEYQWLFAQALFDYFYHEREFYKAVLKFEGQNSFREYFRNFMFQFLEPFVRPDRENVADVAGQEEVDAKKLETFYINFVSDAILGAIVRWINGEVALESDQFVTMLRGTGGVILGQAAKLLERNQDKQ